MEIATSLALLAMTVFSVSSSLIHEAGSYLVSLALEKFAAQAAPTQDILPLRRYRLRLLPLDRSRRLAGDVVGHAGNTIYFVDDAS